MTETNQITLKPSQVSSALEYCLNASQPIALWGEPGIGKSAIVAATAKRLGVALQDVRAVLLDPVDLRGLPHVNGDGRAHWAIPEFLPRDGNGILFLDELNRAPMLVQNACFQLILDRKLGEYTLPDGWKVVTACNRESDGGGGVSRMSSALANRFTHINVEPDLEDWCKWAVTHGIEPVVIAFLRFRPELLHKFDRNNRAFPSPRSWSFVSGITAQKPAGDIELALVAGSVGHGAAIDYMAFLKLYRSLPSIDAILLNPTGSPVPTEASTLYAVSSALARRAQPQNLGRIVQYLDRLPVEFNVMAIRDATTRDAQLSSTPEFTSWAVKHSEVVF